jgi:hypothetical protein
MNSQNDKPILALTVIEAYIRDVGRDIALIEYDSMNHLDVTTGDIRDYKRDQTNCCQMQVIN